MGVSFDVQLYRRDENLSHVILKSVLHMELDFRLQSSFVLDNLVLKAAKHRILTKEPIICCFDKSLMDFVHKDVCCFAARFFVCSLTSKFYTINR